MTIEVTGPPFNDFLVLGVEIYDTTRGDSRLLRVLDRNFTSNEPFLAKIVKNSKKTHTSRARTLSKATPLATSTGTD